ncbi:MAG: hypothetical protein AAB466_14195 [Verrucomicrobiota bacterium]
MNPVANRETISDAPSAGFVALAGLWCAALSANLLRFVWLGYDALRRDMPPAINKKDLERSLTQLLAPRIRRVMSGDEPFDFEHGPYERETMKPPPAQPPQYDLAFVLRADERVMWPLEAKKLETDGAVADYVDDVRNQFLRCRYAPFSSEGAMLGYLLSGSPAIVFKNISAKVPCSLEDHPAFPNRPHKFSRHRRQVAAGKSHPREFRYHHLILEFPELRPHGT